MIYSPAQLEMKQEAPLESHCHGNFSRLLMYKRRLQWRWHHAVQTYSMLSDDSPDILCDDLLEHDMLQPLQTPPPPPATSMLHLLLSVGTSVDNFSPRSRVLLQQSLWLAAKAVEGIEAVSEEGASGWGGCWGEDWEGNHTLKEEGEKERDGGREGDGERERERECNFGKR